MGMHASVQLQKLSPSTSQNPTEFISHISNSILHDHNTMWKPQRLQLKIPKNTQRCSQIIMVYHGHYDHQRFSPKSMTSLFRKFYPELWGHHVAKKQCTTYSIFFLSPTPPLRLSFGWLLKYLQIKCTASTSHVILVVFFIWSKKTFFFPNLLPS